MVSWDLDGRSIDDRMPELRGLSTDNLNAILGVRPNYGETVSLYLRRKAAPHLAKLYDALGIGYEWREIGPEGYRIVARVPKPKK